MDLHVSAITKAQDGITEGDMDSLKIHCGINAGISQCRETFLDSNADHAMVEVVFENASRMMAMVMNSLRFHATTEKSGRYTEMKGDDAAQCALYDKWNAIFKKHILELYPDYNDVFLRQQLEKRGFDTERRNCWVENGKTAGTSKELDEAMEEILAMPSLPSNTRAQENARYALGIFTKSTAFGYTTSLAQWNYIYDWCMKYISQFTDTGERRIIPMNGCMKFQKATFFESSLYDDLSALASFIKENLYVEHLRDHKKRCFSMLTNIAEPGHPMKSYTKGDKHLGFSYCTQYEGSFILLSHLHHHRTIQYWMEVPPEENMSFYIPKMIKGTSYEDEWLSDLNGIRHLYPQGTLVRITEAGTLDNFALKTSERLCGCAQLETMENVRDLALEFARHAAGPEGTPMERQYTSRFYEFAENSIKKGRLKTKAEITDGCREGCYFKCRRALDRMI